MIKSITLLRSSRLNDPYLSLFSQVGFDAECVPVLLFRFVNESELRNRLSKTSDYSGLIITSPRSVKAIKQSTESGELVGSWTETVAYVVGQRTEEAAISIGLQAKGASSGRASQLAKMIKPAAQPYLFLAGSRRRDVLPVALKERGISFEEMTVYETFVRGDIDASDIKPGWLAFFSPSGIEAVQDIPDVRDRRIAAIGPTTARALRKQGFTVDAVAGEPSAEGLLAAIQRTR